MPIIGALLLVPGFFSVAGITGIPGLSFISALTSPYKYAPYVMAGWVVFGIGMLLWLRSRNPAAIDAVAHIHLDDEAAAPAVVPGPAVEEGEAA